MGLGGISIWQLLIVLVIVVLIFGTKKLRNTGGDLGSAISNFKKAMKDGADEVDEKAEKTADAIEETADETVDAAKKTAEDVKDNVKNA